MSETRSVYLDHAATTPMHAAAVEAMAAALAEAGNASSLHSSGRAARRRLEESRESIAARLGARPSEVIFTAGGTESDNLAVKGITWARQSADPRRRRLIASAVEHHAVLDRGTPLDGCHSKAQRNGPGFRLRWSAALGCGRGHEKPDGWKGCGDTEAQRAMRHRRMLRRVHAWQVGSLRM